MTEQPEKPRSTPNPPSTDTLKTLSISARWRAYEALRTFGPMTSRELGKKVGVSEAAMAVHLRELHRIKFVTWDGDLKRPRSLEWSAVKGGVELGAFDRSEDYANAASGWMKVLFSNECEMLTDWVAVAPQWPPEWRSAAENADRIMRLSVEELQQMAEEMRTLMMKWKARSEDRSIDDPRYRATIAITHAFPYPDEY